MTKKIGVLKAMRLCGAYEKMNAEERCSLQARRLKELVEYARKNSPFYQRLYRDVPKRKSVEEIWEGEQIPGVSDIVRFAPSACNSQPWYVKNDGEISVYRYKKPGKRGIMPADKVSFYNRIDIGIFICFIYICLEHSGIGFEKKLYSDDGEDKECVLNAKYRLCR